MIIILEGPDGAGKTVLATILDQRLTRLEHVVATQHHGPYAGCQDPSLNYLASLERQRYGRYRSGIKILDRCWLSEIPYGRALRGGADRVGTASRRMLERVALRLGAFVILCRPSFETCQRNWAQRRAYELAQDNETIKKIYDGYAPEALASATSLPVVAYDYTGTRDALEPALAQIIALKDYAPPEAGVGRWHPDSTLLVGDRVSRYGFNDLPFVSFTRGGCSQWLAQKLEGWGVPESKLYWVNALGLDPEFLGHEGAPKRVVALGANAARWCERAGIGFTRVAHPQAHKRFRFNEEYADLKEALL